MGLGSLDFWCWFRDQGWLLQKGSDKSTSTHYFLDGGKGRVEDPDAFHWQLARALFHHEKVFAVEVRTEVFRLYADLDPRDRAPCRRVPAARSGGGAAVPRAVRG